MELQDAIPQYLRETSVLPWREVRIMPIGDIQAGSPGTDWSRLRRHIQWGVDHDCWFIGMGDYSDFLSPSNRRALRNSGLYDTATDLIERWHDEHLKELTDVLLPTKGRWLGMHEGHHYYEYSDGTTTDTRLCQSLEAPFLGTCSVLRLPFRDGSKHGVDCLIWGHHGEGGGDDPLRRLMRVAPGFPQIDIFLQGHNTSIDARPKDVIEFYGGLSGLKARDRTQMFVATGGFMRGYAVGSRIGSRGRAQGSYVEKAMMRPTAIGGPLIYITPRHKHGYAELDIKVSV